MAEISGTMDILAYDPESALVRLATPAAEIAELLKKHSNVVDAYVDERGQARAVIRGRRVHPMYRD